MFSLSRLHQGFSEAKSPLQLRHVQFTAAPSLLLPFLTFFKHFPESPGQSSQQLPPSLPGRSALLSCPEMLRDAPEMMSDLCKHSSKVYLTRLCVTAFVEGPVFLLWWTGTFVSPALAEWGQDVFLWVFGPWKKFQNSGVSLACIGT